MMGEPLRILLVEDNPAHAELVIRNLRQHRVANTIHHISDGEEALHYLLRKGRYADAAVSPRPHIVLLDLRLPKIDGLEVLQTIKTHDELRQLPVIVLTTSNAESDVARAYEFHANSYLVKPVDFEKFTELMESLGFYWLAWNCQPALR